MSVKSWDAITEAAVDLLFGHTNWSSITRQLRHGIYVVAFDVAPLGVTVLGPPAADVKVLGWGDTAVAAYRQALACMARGDQTLTTPEVTVILGTNRNTARDHARRGRLPYYTRGDANRPSRFLPRDVWALLVKLDKFAREDGEGVGLR